MSQREFDREISPEDQLREVSLILMQAVYRLKRHGPPPRPPRIATPPAAPKSPTSASTRPKRALPKPRHAKWKPGTREHQLKNLLKKRKRVPHKTVFWQEQVLSIHNVPRIELDRAVCRMDALMLDLEFREAFEHVIRTLSPDDRRLAGLVGERGLTHAARAFGTSWRQVMNALVRMREVFEFAGFGPDRGPRPVRRISELPEKCPIGRDAL